MFSGNHQGPSDPRLQQEHHQQQTQFGGGAFEQQQSSHYSPSQSDYNMGSYGVAYPSEQQQQQQQHHYSPQQASRDSTAGPSRHSISGPSHRRDYSQGGGGSGGGSAGGNPSGGRNSGSYGPGNGVQGSGRAAGGPYARPMEPVPLQANGLGGATHTVKASSTTSEFTKRKNWSQHIIDEIQDFMHVLAPNGDFMFVSPSVNELAGWAPEELVGRPVSDFVHPEDIEGYRRDFTTSLTEGQDLTLYCRFRTKDDRYVLFEVTGHPYYAEYNGQQNCKCFFAMGRPYPSKNQAMLDSFLELKFENERLRQELQVLYKDIEGGGEDGKAGPAGYSTLYGGPPDLIRSGSFDRRTSEGGVIDPVTGLVQAGGLLPSSSNTYGALGIGISTNGSNKGDGHEKKKKKPRAEEGEFVCRDCGTVDSPEWRKGPEGPKSLCNACGLRYAKLTSKAAKQAKAEKK